jgi:hypothetical protein
MFSSMQQWIHIFIGMWVGLIITVRFYKNGEKFSPQNSCTRRHKEINGRRSFHEKAGLPYTIRIKRRSTNK